MICKNCGGDIGEGLKFCPNCGTSVESMAETVEAAASTAVDESAVEPVIEETSFPEPAEFKEPEPAAEPISDDNDPYVTQGAKQMQKASSAVTAGEVAAGAAVGTAAAVTGGAKQMQRASTPAPAPAQQSTYKPYDPQAAEGKSKATTSLVLGIIGIVCNCTYYAGAISIILGAIGLSKASKAKKLGYDGGVRKAGFATSLVSLILGILEVIGLIIMIVVIVLGAAAGISTAKKYDNGDYDTEISRFVDELDLEDEIDI